MKKMMKNRRLGAISTEYVIILVLIAVAGILGFMFLGSQLRAQSKNITDKVSGASVTTTEVKKTKTDDLTTKKAEMKGTGEGDTAGEVSFQ